MKRCLIFLIALAVLSGCAFGLAGAETDRDGHVLTRFYFSRGGYMVPQSREICFAEDGCAVRVDDNEPRPFDPAAAAELVQIIKDYRLDAWDGFHESDSRVLDGENFSLEMEYSDGTTVYASGENAFPDGYHAVTAALDDILRREEMGFLAGVYRYEGEGCGGDFTITLNADGTYSFYEGFLSSYIGAGTWDVFYGRVYLDEDDEAGFDLRFMFDCEKDALAYISAGSDAFPYVNVADGGRFVRAADAE